MRAFIEHCRRKAAVAGTVVLSVFIVSASSISPASADETYRFTGQSSSEAPRTSSARKMRLGAYRERAPRESLSGGSRRITSGKRTRKTASAKRRRGVQVASLGESYQPRPEVGTSLSGGGGVKWVANASCLNARLRAVVYQVASAFGPVTVNSTCRGRRHNARVGGARHSHHLSGNAVDFRVHGRGARGVYAFLRSHASVGGLKFYRRGFFHIDVGARRTW